MPMKTAERGVRVHPNVKKPSRSWHLRAVQSTVMTARHCSPHAWRLSDGLRWALVLALLGTGAGLHGRSIDHALFLQLHQASQGWAVPASWLSVLGLGLSVLILSGALALKWPRCAAASWCVVVLGGLLVQVVKSVVDAPRPPAVLGLEPLYLVGPAIHSRAMPSGHAALLAGVAALALWPSGRSPRRWLIGAMLAGLCVAGAWARVAVGAHWPADVLVGTGLGGLVGAAVAGTGRGQQFTNGLTRHLTGRAGSRLMAAGLVGLSGSLWLSRDDYPEARGLCALLVLTGLAAALAWWRRHPGPPRTAGRRAWRMAGAWR